MPLTPPQGSHACLLVQPPHPSAPLISALVPTQEHSSVAEVLLPHSSGPPDPKSKVPLALRQRALSGLPNSQALTSLDSGSQNPGTCPYLNHA